MISRLRPSAGALALTALLAGQIGCASSGANRGDAETAGERVPPDPSEVTSEDIDRQRGTSIEEILADRVAGVQVTRAPGGIQVLIRGATSIRGDNQPLYVIDGVPVEPGPNGFLPIQPYDIESIKVLKDPVDTTFYGVRGANGVIVIKTKRG